MKVGTRLTMVLLLCVMPVLAIYMTLTVRAHSETYIQDLERATRATASIFEAGVEPDVADRDWSSVARSLLLTRKYGVEAAVFDINGKASLSLPNFALKPAPRPELLRKAIANGSTEFFFRQRGRYWLCRAVPLITRDGKTLGILLVARDWSHIQHDVDRRIAVSLAFGGLVMVLIATIIPIVTKRYVTRPLAELSRRVRRFSATEEPPAATAGDEVALLSEEFRRLDADLKEARQRLLDDAERQLGLERRLRRSDKLAAIGTLASGLAHEIGTPLNVIRGRAEHLLATRSHPPRTAEILETIINQIDRITQTVRMLLDLGRRPERPRALCDVRTIVQRTLDLLETEAARRNVSFVCELGNTPLMVDCDADQLQQVFVNLGVNALDAMTERGGTLRILANRTYDNGHSRVRLLFDDSGPGIPRSDRDRVFDPFFTTKEPGRGTGMGLAVSQAIIRDHDGQIAVESATSGARFVVTLPVRATAAEIAK
jgi:two-component system, NtrC family, sensor kinase